MTPFIFNKNTSHNMNIENNRLLGIFLTTQITNY